MQNIIRQDTLGKWETVNANFELLQRGTYTYHVPQSQLKPVDLNSNKKSPLEIYEAQNAVQIAEYRQGQPICERCFSERGQLMSTRRGL